MFRELRRTKQQLSERETIEILENGKTAVLGVVGDGGYPYTVPLNYVYADGKIYFHCAKAGHKLDAIKRDDKVSLCVIGKDDIVAEELTTYFKSVVVFGRARILETDEEIRHAAEVFGLKYNDDEDFIHREIDVEMKKHALCCVEIEIENMTGKQAIELLP